MPGPTLNTVRGRKVSVLHRNELPVPAVVHLHGAHAAPEHDGYPTDLVLRWGRTTTATSGISTVRAPTSRMASAYTSTTTTSVRERTGITITAWTSPLPQCGRDWPACI